MRVDYRQYFGYISSTITKDKLIALVKEILKKGSDLTFLGNGTRRT